MNGKAILENVRRYRAIASCIVKRPRFVPFNGYPSWNRPMHGKDRALAELEAHFDLR